MRFTVIGHCIKVFGLHAVPFTPFTAVAGVEDRDRVAGFVVDDFIQFFRNMARQCAMNLASVAGNAVERRRLAD